VVHERHEDAAADEVAGNHRDEVEERAQADESAGENASKP